ncbi:hypothetical protein Gohar_021559 [Gossypium harknessii]|uniref:Uncharacterized protein n=1 Tax=Gossypium harknessii TaxID=34285 RepID=A0A7J9ID43_9ROSI|nr:hypothetical protein [Gossypium harknessii]
MLPMFQQKLLKVIINQLLAKHNHPVSTQLSMHYPSPQQFQL